MKFVTNKKIYLLFVFVVGLLFLSLSKTYANFPDSYEFSDNVVVFSLDYNVSITDVEEYQEIETLAGESKKFNIKITNNLGTNAYYGVWYRMVEPSTINSNISIGRLESSSTNTSGSINSGITTTVTIAIKNETANDVIIDVGIATSNTAVSNIEYLNGKSLITGTVDIPNPEPPAPPLELLSTKSKGEYVSYVGNNGCSGASCNGQNANYQSDSNMGYCFRTSNRYKVNGWRIAYIEGGSAYLVSAGGLECVATDETGTICYSRPDTHETTTGIPMHISNLNSLALKYCNSTYAYGDECNSSNSWAFNALDFEKVTGNRLNSSDCFHKAFSTACGYNNNMIDIGSYFWINTHKDNSEAFMFYWESNLFRTINESYTGEVYGLRPVLKLKENVYVDSGSGTYADPYVIVVN